MNNPPTTYLEPAWDENVAKFSDASFFHGSAWGATLVTAYGFNPIGLTLGMSGRPTAMLPVMEVNSWLTGRRGITLPYTDACDALTDGDASFRNLWDELHQNAKTRRWQSWELRGSRARHGAAPPSASFWGHRLLLGAVPEEVFARLQGSVRTSVRKALNHNLTIQFSSHVDAIRTFHGLLCKTRKRHGLPPQPLSFFESLHRHILNAKQGWVVLAKRDDVPVAGAVFFHSGKDVIYKYAASDSAFRELQANNLVLWRAIEWYSQNGFSCIDFGRSSFGNEGLRRFKRAWGTVEHLIEYIKFDLRKSRFVTSQDQSSGWHNRLFRLLPGPLAEAVGATAYKHLA